MGDYKILGKTINPHIDANRVIYLSNRSLYWPKVTHELCERGHGQNKQRVGFTVISIKDNHKAGPIVGLQNAAQLADGVYILKSVRKVEIPNEVPQFEETWEELRADSMILPQSGSNPTFTTLNTFTRTVDEKLASFPGIGARRFQVDVGAGDVAKMQNTIEKMNQNILSISLKHADANSLLLVGYSGSGKSVLINLLLGGEQNLRIQRISGGLRLAAQTEYSKIGHERKRGTGVPQGFWVSDYDPNIGSNTALWDLCGLGDPSGTFADIPNAFNLRRLFSNIGDGNVKIALVTEQAKLTERDNTKGFLPLLNDLSAVFPNFDELKKIVSSLVVSRYDGNDDVVEVLKDILAEQQGEDEKVQRGEQREITELSANARLLLQYLIDEENKQAESRIIHFPGITGMRDGNSYSAGEQVREAVLEAFKNTKGNVRPNVDPLKVVRNSSDAVKLAASINNSVAKYIGTQVIDSLFRLARSKIIENVQSVKKLKENLVDLKNNLTKIRDLSTTPEKFLKKLSKLFGGTGFFDSTPIETGIAALSFLAEVKPEIEAKFRAEWAPQLTYAIEALGKLSKEVPADKADLRGAIVGASDITRYFTTHPDATSLSVYATHAFIMDESVDRSGHGTTIKLIAPYWKILDKYSFNLTGKNGDTGTTGGDGTDGQGATAPIKGTDGGPGQPGKPGGNFFGQGFVFSDIESLSVIVNGGQGGDGGKGGKGGKGRDRFGGMQEIPNARSGDICQYPYNCHMIPHGDREVRRKPMEAANVDLMAGGTQNVKDWIGEHWHDQGSVRIHTTTYATPGEAGKSGGKGGQKGLGGKSGDVLLLGADGWTNYEKKDGEEATNKGDGGDGGNAGILSKRKAWVGCQQRDEGLRDLANVWDGAAYDEGDAGSAGKPTDSSDTDPDNPSDADALNRDTADYITFYKAQAKNPSTFPWVQRFPGLFDH